MGYCFLMSSWTYYIIWVGFCCEFCLFYGPTCLKFHIIGRDITLGTVKWFGERVPFWRSELGPSGFCAAVLCIVEMMILFSICFFFNTGRRFFLDGALLIGRTGGKPVWNSKIFTIPWLKDMFFIVWLKVVLFVFFTVFHLGRCAVILF